MNPTFLSEAAQTKHIEEEICGYREPDVSLGWCGMLAHKQCGSCTMFICEDHAQTCKTCRDLGKHHLYCPNCKNTHKHGALQETIVP